MSIRKIQPSGPYRLAGWSLGGTVAHEMAHQLLGSGESVEFLGLIASYIRIDSGEVSAHLKAKEDVLTLVRYVRSLGAPIEPATLTELESCPNLQQAFAAGQNAGYLPTGLSLDAVKSRIAAALRLTEVANHCDPPTLPISIYYFAAAEARGKCGSAGWKPRIGGTLSLEIIAGTHASMMLPPHVKSLGAAMSAALGATGSGEPREYRALVRTAG
jgi:thioesterase domain-containing protein